MNNTQVCNAFAQKATKGKGPNLFIDGIALYSYGYHFIVAKWVGHNTVVVTRRRYSPTTDKYTNYALRTLINNNVTVIRAYNLSSDCNNIEIELTNIEIGKLITKANKSTKNKQFYLDQANRLKQELIEYYTHFNKLNVLNGK